MDIEIIHASRVGRVLWACSTLRLGEGKERRRGSVDRTLTTADDARIDSHMHAQRTDAKYSLPMMVACQWNRSSPTGPAEQFAGGSRPARVMAVGGMRLISRSGMMANVGVSAHAEDRQTDSDKSAGWPEELPPPLLVQGLRSVSSSSIPLPHAPHKTLPHSLISCSSLFTLLSAMAASADAGVERWLGPVVARVVRLEVSRSSVRLSCVMPLTLTSSLARETTTTPGCGAPRASQRAMPPSSQPPLASPPQTWGRLIGLLAAAPPSAVAVVIHGAAEGPPPVFMRRPPAPLPARPHGSFSSSQWCDRRGCRCWWSATPPPRVACFGAWSEGRTRNTNTHRLHFSKSCTRAVSSNPASSPHGPPPHDPRSSTLKEKNHGRRACAQLRRSGDKTRGWEAPTQHARRESVVSPLFPGRGRYLAGSPAILARCCCL